MKIYKDKTGQWYGSDTNVLLDAEKQKFNGKAFVNYFKSISKNTWSDNSIVAMLCNIASESHVNPMQSQLGGGSGYGLTQWTPKTKLQKRAKLLGYESTYNTMLAECSVIDAERTNKNGEFGQWSVRNSNYGLSFDAFATSNQPVRYLVGCFLCSYEGASDQSESEIDRRYNGVGTGVTHTDWEQIVDGGGGGASGSVDGFLAWLKMIADNNEYIYEYRANHGVPWDNYLTVKKFDCSSYVSFGLKNGGGYDLATQFATSTQKQALAELGFDIIPFQNKNQLKRGDILLEDGHTEVVFDVNNGDVTLIGAHQHYPNDSAKDISTMPFYNDPWTDICRPFDNEGKQEFNRKRDPKPMTFLTPRIWTPR